MEDTSHQEKRVTALSCLPANFDSRKRNSNKKMYVLLYLAKFKYTTKRILSDFLGLSIKGQQDFYTKLEKSGLLYRKTKVYLSPGEYLYGLGSLGASYAKEKVQKFSGYEKLEKIPGAKFRHSAFLQLIFNKVSKNGLGDFNIDLPPEYLFDYVLNEDEYRKTYLLDKNSKRPDLICPIEKQGEKFLCAIEAEIYKKDDKDIYKAFAKIYQDIELGRYQICRYYFLNQSTLNHYKKIYDKPEWSYGWTRTTDEKGKFQDGYTETVKVGERYVYAVDCIEEEFKIPKIEFILFNPPDCCKKYVMLQL
jgi:hypothetical protein